MQKEIVAFNVKDVPLATVKEKLAKAVVGEWTTATDGTEYLGPDVSARNILARADLQARKESIAKTLKKLQDSLTAKQPEDVEGIPTMGFGMGMGGGAANRLTIQLSFGLQAADLAAVPKGGRVVYSTSPNAMQKPLNVPGLQKYVDEFVAANNKEASVATDPFEGKDPAEEEKLAQAEKLFGMMMPKLKKIETPPTKILVIVERGGMFAGMGDSLELRVVAFDGAGSVLANGSASLESPFGEAVRASVEVAAAQLKGQEKPKEEVKPHDPKLDKKIELSPLTIEFKSMTSGAEMMQSDKQPSPELWARILRPDLYDPLSYDVSESLLAMSDVEGTNMIAAIPDDAVDMGGMMRGGKEQTVFSFKESLKGNKSVKVETVDGWTLLSSTHPLTSTAMRVDRVSLAKLLESTQKSMVPTLDAMAAYAAINPPIMETPVVMPTLMFAAPNAISMGMRGVQDWPMLRLYGLLGAPERETLKRGQTLPFAGVNSGAQGILKQMVFGAGGRFQIGPDVEEKGLGFMAMAMSMMGQRLDSFKQEPTELLPNGLPAQGGLSLNLKAGHFIMADSKAGMAKFFGAMGPEEYSMLKYFSEEPKMAAAGGMMPKIDKFKVGERDTLDFRLLLAADVTQKHTLMDHRMGKDAATVGESALPADFMAEVEKQMKLFKEGLAPFLSAPGMFGGGVPPVK